MSLRSGGGGSRFDGGGRGDGRGLPIDTDYVILWGGGGGGRDCNLYPYLDPFCPYNNPGLNGWL